MRAQQNGAYSQPPLSGNGHSSRVVFSNTPVPAQPAHVHVPVQSRRCLIDVWQRGS